MDSQNELALDLRGVKKSYPGVMALDGIDLKVKTGSVHGFIGPNGAGKSTTMKIIAGLIPPSEGEILVNGKDALKNPHYISSTIGLLPETPPLYLNMRVKEYLEFCQSINMGDLDFPHEHLERMIQRCGLEEVKGRLIANLSRGFKQRVAMAQALVYGAKIIILDEPTVGLDPKAIAEVRELIKELRKDHTILLSSHQLYEVGRVCDEVTIIDKGKIIKSGNLLDVQSEFSAFKTYEALIPSLNESLKATLMAKEYIQGFDSFDHKGEILLRIHINGHGDYRSKLTELLTKESSLLQFVEKTMELEDIFKEVVR